MEVEFMKMVCSICKDPSKPANIYIPYPGGGAYVCSTACGDIFKKQKKGDMVNNENDKAERSHKI